MHKVFLFALVCLLCIGTMFLLTSCNESLEPIGVSVIDVVEDEDFEQLDKIEETEISAEETEIASEKAEEIDEKKNPSDEQLDKIEEIDISSIVIPQMSARLQNEINEIAKSYNAMSIQIAMIRNGRVVAVHSYGYAISGVRAVDDDTKYRVASITKAVLAMVVMQQYEMGNIDLDRDISEYWDMPVRNPYHPDIPITIRQLLTHTSSLQIFTYGSPSDGDLVRSRFVDGSGFVDKVPGLEQSWQYNNYGYSVLGLTVELATGRTINDLAKEYLFSPLGINAGFGIGPLKDKDNIATLYRYNREVGRSIEFMQDAPGGLYPGDTGLEFAGGLVANAGDAARLFAVLANGGEYRGIRVLQEESVRLMEKVVLERQNFGQGLALRRTYDLFGEWKLYYHTGSHFGLWSFAAYSAENRNGVVVLTSGAQGRRGDHGINMVTADIGQLVLNYLRGPNLSVDGNFIIPD